MFQIEGGGGGGKFSVIKELVTLAFKLDDSVKVNTKLNFLKKLKLCSFPHCGVRFLKCSGFLCYLVTSSGFENRVSVSLRYADSSS